MKNVTRGGEDTRNMLGWVTYGLAYLHSQGVIHADLKSQNILVSHNCKPALADFGLSSALSHTRTRFSSFAATGTVKWIATELFEGEVGNDKEAPNHTMAADEWTLGMVA